MIMMRRLVLDDTPDPTLLPAEQIVLLNRAIGAKVTEALDSIAMSAVSNRLVYETVAARVFPYGGDYAVEVQIETMTR